MPLYVYRKKDGSTVTVYQKVTDAPLAEDEDGQPMHRIIAGPVPVIFKGSGFYSTDTPSKTDVSHNRGNNE